MNYDYLKASDGSGDPALMTINTDRLIGSTTLVVNTVLNVPAKFIGTSGTKLATGFIDPSTKTEFLGHVSGGGLVIDSFEPGYSDAGNTSGQVIVVRPATGWANRVAAFIANATGFGTPEALHASDVTVTDAILLDGVTNATFRYKPTATDLSNAYFQTSFAHGLSYTPWVTGRVLPFSASSPMPLPFIQSTNTNYFGVPPSSWIVLDRADATNIYINGGITDAYGLSMWNTNSANPGFRFQFYCSRKPGV